MKTQRDLSTGFFISRCLVILCLCITCSCSTKPETGTITFYVFQGERNAYCFIDDSPVGICLTGEKLSIEVEAGNHELRAYSTYYFVVHSQMAGYLCGEKNVNISEDEIYQWEIDSDVDMGYFVDL